MGAAGPAFALPPDPPRPPRAAGDPPPPEPSPRPVATGGGESPARRTMRRPDDVTNARQAG
eukprot:12371563-Alexandrium_andersonii.AAC.1